MFKVMNIYYDIDRILNDKQMINKQLMMVIVYCFEGELSLVS